MSNFLNDNYLLTSSFARELYHKYAAKMPIIDYHCHLDPKEIFENKNCSSITELWISSGKPNAPIGDHYKWRLMRAAGFDERFITGDATDKEKFTAFAKTLESALGNPIYEWSHLELKRFFKINKMLNSQTAETIWSKTNSLVRKDAFKPRNLIANANVEIVVTTDDPIDNLQYHISLAKEEKRFRMLPAWRPDRILNIFKADFADYVSKLSASSGIQINSLKSLESALLKRMDFFASVGCTLADHGLEVFYFAEAQESAIDDAFRRALAKQPLSANDVAIYHTHIQKFLAKQYAKRNWVMQMHISALRDLNSAAFIQRGANTGHDAITDLSIAENVRQFFDSLEIEGYNDSVNYVPRTMLYSLNKNDWMVLSTIGGTHLQNLASIGVKQKFQLGPAWWFNDNQSGMYSHFDQFAQTTLLGNFTGMLTDSRSLLSYTRHEYFRRVLCQYLGDLAERGQIEQDLKSVGKMVQNISYHNAKSYFNF